MKLIIDIPKATYDYWKEHKDEYVLSEAIANAIPYDDSGDLISRSELMKAIGTMVEAEMPIDEKWALGLKHSLKVIDNAPTVEYTFEEAFQKTVCEHRLYCPTRPKGKWVEREYRRYLPRDAEPYYNNDTYDEKTHSYIDTHIVCSECGAERRFYHDFCGNCGADMREGDAKE
jgi:hypothetical protein